MDTAAVVDFNKIDWGNREYRQGDDFQLVDGELYDGATIRMFSDADDIYLDGVAYENGDGYTVSIDMSKMVTDESVLE